MKMKHYEITTLFGHTLYLSYTKERLSQEVSRVAELFQEKYITETVFIRTLLDSFLPPEAPAWDERPLI